MASSYQMWLTHNGGTERIRFPVLPETITVRKRAENESVSIQGLGEVVIKQNPEAVVISFSSFFPATPFPGVQFDLARARGPGAAGRVMAKERYARAVHRDRHDGQPLLRH